ncbi:MAG: PEP-CTERM sorting domain-containing protein, partial [Myxococcales bacterium]|nr:PEP-CTERM sorting domain-containing protein [Myxococcales bacterium]
LNFPSKVRFVNAVLSGSNGQVDFNNLGFTGEVSVPEPATALLLLVGLLSIAAQRRTRAGA